MKKKALLFLALEGAACVLYVLLGQKFPSLFGAAAAFPVQQVGYGLRVLSLSGAVQNGIATILYCAFCLLPLGWFFLRYRKKRHEEEDWLLVLMTAVLFPVMYLMVNPHLMGTYLGKAWELGGSMVLGSALWSILAGYLILRFLRSCFRAEEQKWMDYLKLLLLIMAAALVLGAFGTGLENLLDSIQDLKESNQGSESGLGWTVFFLVLRYAADILPNLLCCFILLDAGSMLEQMKENTWSETVVNAAGKLSHSCGTLLKLLIGTNVGINLLQLLFAKQLRVVDSTISLPLDIMALVIGMLLVSRFIRSHKELKEENDSFI